jgi:hypothetical protein
MSKKKPVRIVAKYIMAVSAYSFKYITVYSDFSVNIGCAQKLDKQLIRLDVRLPKGKP